MAVAVEDSGEGARMKVLVACEESQEVCKAFRALGHEAWSCDIQDCSGGRPEWHIKGDVLPVLRPWELPNECFWTMNGIPHHVGTWDLIVAFPPCTDLAVSGARWFAEKQADGRQQRSIEFFMQFVNADCPQIAIENPIGIMSRIYRKPDQIIQPWQFGHPYTKTTCLWLKGLPRLVPTNVLQKPASGWENQHITKDGRYGGFGGDWCKAGGKWLRYGDPRVAKERSKTFPGIARAMAEQWGGRIEEDKP